MNKTLLVVSVLLAAGCSDKGYIQSESSKSIYNVLKKTNFESIDFNSIGGEKWSKVCFFGPYSSSSPEVIGFEWYVSNHTGVLKSDGHNVIVFATENEAIEYVIHSRRYGDFWKLSKKCFKRESSKFTRDPEGGRWKNYIENNRVYKA